MANRQRVIVVIVVLFSGLMLSGCGPSAEELSLLEAIKHHNTELVKRILAEKPNLVNTKESYANRGRTALMQAARKGHLEIVRLLIEKGADINTKDNRGETALMQAAREGHNEIAKLLIDKGADINTKDNRGETALMEGKRRVETAKLLIDRGADINVKDNDGRTTLMQLAALKRIESLKLLIDKGADINAKDNDGRTALMQAARNGHVEETKLLIDNGADINAKDNDSRTALMQAASSGRIETVKLFIEKGLDINIPSGKAILITESAPARPPEGPIHPFLAEVKGRVCLKEIDGRQIDLGDSCITTLSPGVHNIKVRFYGSSETQDVESEPISLFINVKSRHIYAVKYRIKVADPNWIWKCTAWIEKIK